MNITKLFKILFSTFTLGSILFTTTIILPSEDFDFSDTDSIIPLDEGENKTSIIEPPSSFESDNNFENFDNNNIDDLFNSAADIPEVAQSDNDSNSNCLTPLDILNLITPSDNPDDNPPIVNVIRILREDVYKKTTGPVTRRSLLDQPALIFQPHIFDICCGWTFNLQPFYNFTPRVFFTKNSPFLQDYIHLTNDNIITEIEEALKRADFGELDITTIVGLFRQIKLQQHRAGFMFTLAGNYKKLNFSFLAPIYYLVEHFFLTNREIANIRNSPELREINPGTTPDDAIEAFALCHLVSDKVGLGDSRLNLNYNVYNTCNTKIWLGLQATFPTAKTFRAGLIAGKFSPCTPEPEFNLQRIFNLLFCANSPTERRGAEAEVKNITQNFLIEVLDRLSTILINAPLGNGKHVGLGPQLDLQHIIDNYWRMHTTITMEGFFRHRERRFFLVDTPQQAFNRNYRDEAQATENLAFINKEIINTLFPKSVLISIRPGIMAKFRHAFMYDTAHFHGAFGFDFWRQGADEFGAIYEGCIPFQSFKIRKGFRSAAYQGKIFGSLGYFGGHLFGRSFCWHVLFNGDATVFHKGIGNNFTASLRAGIDF